LLSRWRAHAKLRLHDGMRHRLGLHGRHALVVLSRSGFPGSAGVLRSAELLLLLGLRITPTLARYESPLTVFSGENLGRRGNVRLKLFSAQTSLFTKKPGDSEGEPT
jgi:hypothetical protein